MAAHLPAEVTWQLTFPQRSHGSSPSRRGHTAAHLPAEVTGEPVVGGLGAGPLLAAQLSLSLKLLPVALQIYPVSEPVGTQSLWYGRRPALTASTHHRLIHRVRHSTVRRPPTNPSRILLYSPFSILSPFFNDEEAIIATDDVEGF